MNLELLASSITWIVYFIYCFGLLPQIYLNYKLKSATGMSDLMLFGYLTGYLTQFYYVLDGEFPASYIIMIPLSIAAVSVMVFQRFYYNNDTVSQFLRSIYIFVLLFTLFFTPFFLIKKPPVGLYFGWVSTAIWFVYQIPQIVKVYSEKSFKGLSFSFLSLMALAVFLEFISALILDLPGPTVFSNVRALIVYGIFFLQFRLYKTVS